MYFVSPRSWRSEELQRETRIRRREVSIARAGRGGVHFAGSGVPYGESIWRSLWSKLPA
jgi:hypothetical protein